MRWAWARPSSWLPSWQACTVAACSSPPSSSALPLSCASGCGSCGLGTPLSGLSLCMTAPRTPACCGLRSGDFCFCAMLGLADLTCSNHRHDLKLSKDSPDYTCWLTNWAASSVLCCITSYYMLSGNQPQDVWTARIEGSRNSDQAGSNLLQSS